MAHAQDRKSFLSRPRFYRQVPAAPTAKELSVWHEPVTRSQVVDQQRWVAAASARLPMVCPFAVDIPIGLAVAAQLQAERAFDLSSVHRANAWLRAIGDVALLRIGFGFRMAHGAVIEGWL